MGFDKLVTPIAGLNAIERSAELLIRGGCEKLVIVTNRDHEKLIRGLNVSVPVIIVHGGATRTESVRNGLQAIPDETDGIAVIHDAARCFTPVECVRKCIDSALLHGSGVLAIPVRDTLIRTDGEQYETLNREGIWRTQTPQAFRIEEIKKAYSETMEATDDAALYARRIGTPHLVQGDEKARKLTTEEDWKWAKEMFMAYPRFGTGFDTHQLVEGRKLILGGVEIPHEKGLLGHSDADVLIHAIIDAIMGAASLGDIGKAFPDKDEAYRGIDSRILLRRTFDMVQKMDMRVIQVDATIVCQRPKLRPYIDMMRDNIAKDLDLPTENVSVKATTTEGMNDEGKGLCVSAQAIAVLRAHE
ncbi:MAG: 2-C-methyl-D-erythritol 2,4-cyclodiphosphate synthase [Clostridia bacterium]|nr:2-C-methyl-D-erythritol 2,4-cyclodiphosphate synthase [Clostridia bacterium]